MKTQPTQPVNLDEEIAKTRPDYRVYRPREPVGSAHDTGNEHFLVFDSPDGSLMAVWTQSTSEGQSDQRIVFARSEDEGEHWTAPRIVAGPSKPGEGPMASWGFPLVSRSGRIYVIYSRNPGRFDHNTGLMTGLYSDDAGRTWSSPQPVPFARDCHDNPDANFPPTWIVWQKPQRLLSDGRYFVGFTRWVSSAVRHKPPINSWIAHESVVEFMRFDNVDDNVEPNALRISFFATDKQALRVGFPGHPEVSVVQEPSLVKLPDGRLFCVMRTSAGSPHWTASQDDGKTWSAPAPLCRRDGGEPLKHPLSPCPIYDANGDAAASGRYLLLFHNHDGHFQKWTPTDTQFHRRPICLVTGEFKAGAKQPVWFDEPRFLMDHDGVALGPPGKGRCDLAMYSSFTVRKDRRVLWYPDRKFFLLGKRIEP